MHLLLVCTGERGLCGAFNSAIVRLARERALALIGPGQGGQDLLRRPQGLRAAAPHVRQADHRARRAARRARSSASSTPRTIAKKVLALFEAGEFDVCTLFYSRFKSVIAQIPTAQQIIPLVFEAPAGERRPGASYEYEPEEDEILDALLPRNLAVQIFRALLENNASFYGAQMSAMDNATRNAGDMIRKQTLIYNRTRQAHDHQGTDRDHLRRRGAVTRHARSD